MDSGTEIRESWMSGDGVRLHCLEAGDPDAPAVLLLHGFPEFSYGWRHQLPALARAGFRAIAPDLRGYNLSDKPKRVRDYRVEALVADVRRMIEQLPQRRASLVGHDWGGIVAWFAGMWDTGFIEKLVILNAPHPAAYVRELRRSSQLLRSWYAFFFQVPWLPEAIIRRNHFALLRRLFREGPARSGEARNQDVERYVEAIARPGALTAAINYYRAAMRRGFHTVQQSVRPTDLPTLLIWGDRDPYLVRGLTEGLERWAPDLRVTHLPNATHWVQHDAPEEVNRLLIEFLGQRQ